jgi:hypothetical protein
VEQKPSFFADDTSPGDASDTGEAANSEADLAKKLSNPVASLISVPFQSNFDFGGGTNNHAFRYTMNVQPVIPISLNDQFNLIVRVITPFIYQQEQFPGQQDNTGLGDTTPSFFLSPKKPIGGWIVGAGPVLLLPTATDTALGGEKWGIGPTIVVLQQKGPLTYGMLANHIWSFAGEDDRANVNRTFLQPFFAYNTKSGFGVTLQTESTYDWDAHQWTIPIGLFFSQVLKVGNQPIQISAGPRYYAEGPSGAPDWGFRIALTFLFPTK